MHATLASSTPLILGSAAALATAGAAAWSYATFLPRARLFGPVICRGDTSAPSRIALTFDDGPWPGATDAALDHLGEAGVRAVFFVIGVNARKWPRLLRRMRDEGHIVANHTHDHDHWGCLRGRDYWLRQLTRTDEIIQDAIGLRPALFRPPLGFKCPAQSWAARRRGHRIMTWSRRAFDGVPVTADTILARLAPRCEPGDIVTLHDGFEPNGRRRLDSTVDALPRLIQALRARGLEPARADELAGVPAYAAQS